MINMKACQFDIHSNQQMINVSEKNMIQIKTFINMFFIYLSFQYDYPFWGLWYSKLNLKPKCTYLDKNFANDCLFPCLIVCVLVQFFFVIIHLLHYLLNYVFFETNMQCCHTNFFPELSNQLHVLF